jgi:hypothetical protein
MSTLRERMIEDMQLRGFSRRTQVWDSVPRRTGAPPGLPSLCRQGDTALPP